MYCPRCGAQNEEGNRFCVSCGSELAHAGAGAAPAEKRSPRHRLGDLVGRSRRARLLTAGTLLALAVAAIAFAALEPSEQSSGNDVYLNRLDAACAAEKERIATLQGETVGRSRAEVQAFASVLVTIVAEWRSSLRQEQPPAADAAAVRRLEAALLAVLIEAGALARALREGGSPSAIAAQAGGVDAATSRVETAVAELGLERCGAVAIGTG